jgi:prepilin-type N-terminal cleavage/methylation domain-containing protein
MSFPFLKQGFTLAELLIALAILGVIGTFTIPKVLSAQQSSRDRAIAKETIAAIVNVYSAYKMTNLPSASFSTKDLTPYLNYIKLDTSTNNAFDFPYPGTGDCSASSPCIYLHNGAVVQLYGNTFNGTASTNIVWFLVDPDSSRTGSPAGGGLEVALYYNGRVATWATLTPGSQCSWGSYDPDPYGDPPWFNWN